MDSRYRKAAKVAGSFYGKEDHGILTCSIYLDHEEGGCQAFGNLSLDEKIGPAFVSSICSLFGVKSLEELKGMSCYALYSFPYFNEMIEGIEVNGKLFLLTEFRKRFWPDTNSVLEDRKESIKRDIAWATQRIADLEEKLLSIEGVYIEWGDLCLKTG